MSLIEALRTNLDDARSGLTISALFKTPPTLFFDSDVTLCHQCNSTLAVIKTRTRKVSTLAIGVFTAHETVRACNKPFCQSTLPVRGLSALVPEQGFYGYDVIVFVGTQLFIACRSEQEIMDRLREKGNPISRSEIGVLARKFIIYLAIAHQECRKQLQAHMRQHGGYILHLDSTCDADSPHLMCALDGISELVLDNIKTPSENAEQIIPFLQRVKQNFNVPLAVVSDMAKGILNAVAKVFPSVRHFICHFHFLRDIGKDLMSKENDVVRKRLRCQGIQSFLHRQARILKPLVEKDPVCVDVLRARLNDNASQSFCADTSLILIVYVLIHWALEGKKDGDGYGFPFDRPHLSLYQRLCSIHEVLDNLRVRCDKAPKSLKRMVGILWKHIGDTINDPLLKKAAHRMEEKSVVFDRLRQAMRIALPNDRHGLNDDGKKNMNTICQRVTNFQKALAETLKTKPDKDYRSMHDQIKRYWNKLFADPIVKNTPHGTVIIYPQRTNNILERFFRYLRRNHRKRNGNNTMTKTLKAILTDTPLISNLSDNTYRTIILNGAPSLEARFAQIDVNLVRNKLKNEEQENRNLSPKVKKIIRTPELIRKILQTMHNRQ